MKTHHSKSAAPHTNFVPRWARHTLLGLLATTTLASAAAPADSTPIARIGDTEIKIEDVRPLLEKLGTREQVALAGNPALLTQFVRSILVQQILLKEAQANGWDQQPGIAEQLERVRQNAIAESYLQSVAKVAEDYPNQAELQAAYDANKASLYVPRQFRVAQIFIASPKGVDKASADKAQAKLTAVRDSLKKSDFAAVAAAESDEKASGARGGEIGWLAETQVQPEIRAQIDGLAKGTTSEPIRLNDGWHIIKVLDIKEPYTPTLEQVSPQLSQQLRAARAKANGEAYLAKLLQQNKVAINELALSQLLPKAAK